MAGTTLIVEDDPDTVRVVELSGPCSGGLRAAARVGDDAQPTRAYATIELVYVSFSLVLTSECRGAKPLCRESQS